MSGSGRAEGDDVVGCRGRFCCRVPLLGENELKAAGFDTRPMWILPDREWNAMPTKIADGTRLKQASPPSQAGVTGGARINFASPEELKAAGFDTRPMWVLPDRVWNAMSTTIADGTLIRTPAAHNGLEDRRRQACGDH
jgi:hypothetical protein